MLLIYDNSRSLGFLVVQGTRVYLQMQGTPAQSLVKGDPTCCGAAKVVCMTTEPVLWSPGAASA